jgi:hypothetical protein
MTTTTPSTGDVTVTQDTSHDIIWFVERCQSSVLHMNTFIADAERNDDTELADFFRRAQRASLKGAEQGKAFMRSRLGG